ncbi:MAG: class I SAM-dependent methyltransferase [Acidobacteriaceae bacterium]|nr:class I SAM-dependent methyltransferase [Acidobacteriaceae bacterium]
MTYSCEAGGIFMPATPVVHREQEYDSRAFALLHEMQTRHFWYAGRHRFVLQALKLQLPKQFEAGSPLSAIDLGGGCGGWVKFLRSKLPGRFSELALSDSSLCALARAEAVAGEGTARYQADLLKLGWRDRWDVAFLLDVLEHIPADAKALIQVREALKPGGLLFVTTPALNFFRSYNDELARHVRRYTKQDFARLAEASGLRLLRACYFMFFLSPLLWLSRLRRPELANKDDSEMRAILERTHRVPIPPVNVLMKWIFSLETPVGLWVPFPWGTSILGVFQKPR